MKLYNSDYFINKNHCYCNDTKIKNGYLLTKTKSPHIIIKTKSYKTDIDGWFPSIIVAKPTWRQPVEIKGSQILANYPCKAYEFFYTLYENDNTIIKLPKAFKSEWCYNEDDKKDVYINFINETGKIDPTGYYKTGKYDLSNGGGNFVGGFGYDGIHNRYITLQCSKYELRSFFKFLLLSSISVSYDLEYSAQCCANPRKKGTIHPISYEIYKDKIKKFKLKKLVKI